MTDDDLTPAVDEVPVLEVGRRLGIRQFSSLTDWYGSWSPRNDNMHAEGPWAEWVALARAILAHPISDDPAQTGLSDPTPEQETDRG